MKKSVVVIGVGPRGLGVLERLHAHCISGSLPEELSIHLIDAVGEGQGVHETAQPDYLLVNTVAGQITVFADPTVADAGPVVFGPSLAQWANVDSNIYLPRATLGKYLRFAYRYFVDLLSASIPLHEHKTSASRVSRNDDGSYCVSLDNGEKIHADFLFLCTGHGSNRLNEEEEEIQRWVSSMAYKNPSARYIPRCYPLSILDGIPSDVRVGIRGIGLSANDVVAALTAGRGGIFFRTKHGELRYAVSGREPSLYIFSRQSIPFSARAINQKGVAGQHKAAFLTRDAIDLARARRGRYQLNFRQDLLPLLISEMCLAMRRAQSINTASLFIDGPTTEEKELVYRLLCPNDDRQFSDIATYQTYIVGLMQADLQQANRGNVDDPIKAATDVIRDVRDNLRYAIEQRGLTAESHREFFEQFVPAMNRIAVGPPKERVEEWLALIDAGVLKLAGGPGATMERSDSDGCFLVKTQFAAQVHVAKVDVVVDARIEPISLAYDNSPLLLALQDDGLVRPFFNGEFGAGGIDVDSNNHPRNAEGVLAPNMWALGNLAEGANFYTYILPRPMVSSRFIHDAGRAVLEMLAAMRKPEPAREFELSNDTS
ncbi:FAD/NAD(P)-binding protein [Paraburkholderia sp. MM5477-R1]|uniref:FAD/NAD(P)-binding protein n=1 Tax=Paraburkholderia sp. MM5477-R1 TaxID=2991062 RepID=UPI003D1E7F5C